MAIVVTPEEFLDWKQHPVTEALMYALKKQREFLKENLIRDSFENEDFVKGKAAAILDVQELTYEEMMETISDK